MSRRVTQQVRTALVGYDARQAAREARRATIQTRWKGYGYGKWYYRNVTKPLAEGKQKWKTTAA